jgi:hypothetical protein
MFAPRKDPLGTVDAMADVVAPGTSGRGPEVGAPAPTEATASVAAPAAISCLLFAVAFLLYLPSLEAGFAQLDDEPNLLTNERFRGFTWQNLAWMFGESHVGHYHPLTWLSFAVDHQLWGMSPWGYHLTNNLLHAAGTVVVFLVALALLQRGPSRGARRDTVVAGCAALLYAVHPLRVESVTWLTERRDVLSGFFYWLSVLFYLRAAAPGRAAGVASRRAAWAVSLGACLLSTLAKAWGITLPAVLLLADVYLGRLRLAWLPLAPSAWARPATGARVLLEKVPFLALCAACALLAFRAQAESGAMTPWERHGLVHRLVQSCYGVSFYLLKTLLPFDLSPLYEMPRQVSLSEPRFVLGLAGALGVALLAVACRRRCPYLTLALAAYVVIVAPVLGLAQSGPQLVADRYTYLCSVPLFVWACGTLGGRRWFATAALAAAALLALLNVRQQAIWRDPLSFWLRALDANPHGPTTLYNLGFHYHARLDPQNTPDLHADEAARLSAQAQDFYRRCLAADPNAVEALNNLGALLIMEDRTEEALAAWRDSLAKNPLQKDAARIRGLIEQFAAKPKKR